MSVYADTSSLYAVIDADSADHTAFPFSVHLEEQGFICLPHARLHDRSEHMRE